MSKYDSPRSGHSDCISLSALTLRAHIGADCWDRDRPQPVLLTVHVFTSLLPAALSDDVTKTIHYGHLASALYDLEHPNRQFESLLHLAEAAADVVLRNPDAPVTQVRIIAEAPKLLLHAKSLVADINEHSPSAPDTICINALSLPIIIGVNPQERLLKQIVTTSISFYLVARPGPISEPKPVLFLHSDHISSISFLTLEAFVASVARVACFLDGCDLVSITAQKPSAVAFGVASGVSISRCRADFVGL
ncbi:hypothetical protein BU17DRAFT_49322 [Hysterangium stoloniferum]|nr:hypothetical protein BU17DRAFT_49322 [Hysterangium stoloniferum]